MNSSYFIYFIPFIVAAVLSAWALRSLFNSKSGGKNRASSKSELIRRRAIEDFIDGERNPPIPAPLNLSLERFGREQLERLSVDERVDRFNELASVLESNIPKDVKPFEFHNVTIPWLIQGLKDIGHDIWHWDSPGNLSIWGGDYMRPDTAGKVTVEFEHPRTVRVGWEDLWSDTRVVYLLCGALRYIGHFNDELPDGKRVRAQIEGVKKLQIEVERRKLNVGRAIAELAAETSWDISRIYSRSLAYPDEIPNLRESSVRSCGECGKDLPQSGFISLCPVCVRSAVQDPASRNACPRDHVPECYFCGSQDRIGFTTNAWGKEQRSYCRKCLAEQDQRYSGSAVN